jgi:hypothetical protein
LGGHGLGASVGLNDGVMFQGLFPFLGRGGSGQPVLDVLSAATVGVVGTMFDKEGGPLASMDRPTAQRPRGWRLGDNGGRKC